MWSSTLVSSFLLLCAVGLMVVHRRTWHGAQQRALEPREFDYYRRQYRRRMQTSAMLGLLAAAIFVGQWITRPATLAFAYWGGVLLVLGWVGLLALADMLATKQHFARLRREHFVEQAKLHAELRRIQAARSNGETGERNQRPRTP